MVFAIVAQINDWGQVQNTVAGAIGPSPGHRKRLWVLCWLGPPGVRASPPDRSRPAAGALWPWFLMCRLASTVTLDQGDARPYDKLPAFDFAGHFSLKNGINPAALLDRLVTQDAHAVVDTAPHEDCTDVRIQEITGGFDRTSGVFHATVQGIPSSCTSDPADAQAMAWANSFFTLIFLKVSGDPWSPAPPHRRQPNVFDTQNGSFSNTPLTAYTLTERGLSSSGLFGPRFQGWDITTQGGPQS
jgi:hypothetical protein